MCLADGLTLPEVLALVRRHPAVFRETYPARIVNNVYLDTPEFRDYHDHINGVAHRTKTRVRWYGSWSGCIDAPALERKLKQGHVSGKASHGLPPFWMNGYLSRSDLEAAFDGANLAALARSALHHLRPRSCSLFAGDRLWSQIVVAFAAGGGLNKLLRSTASTSRWLASIPANDPRADR